MLVNIYKLFNDGTLLHNYIPPYNIPRPGSNDEYIYIKPKIHFNDIKTIKDWFKFLNPDKTRFFKISHPIPPAPTTNIRDDFIISYVSLPYVLIYVSYRDIMT
jgi:hypothetical protein